jgi:hypothetical protein
VRYFFRGLANLNPEPVFVAVPEVFLPAANIYPDKGNIYPVLFHQIRAVLTILVVVPVMIVVMIPIVVAVFTAMVVSHGGDCGDQGCSQ